MAWLRSNAGVLGRGPHLKLPKPSTLSLTRLIADLPPTEQDLLLLPMQNPLWRQINGANHEKSDQRSEDLNSKEAPRRSSRPPRGAWSLCAHGRVAIAHDVVEDREALPEVGPAEQRARRELGPFPSPSGTDYLYFTCPQPAQLRCFPSFRAEKGHKSSWTCSTWLPAAC